ncbi:mannose-1-phosphate guanylyltransferase [Porphyromonas pogonae]|uniref:mannose-1-phosphate guanylyltransferase n=1 Tax=Porphyromonas pogonae TaxID=867595 RepID=UPI002E77004B|nr:mannose-1-phosphate guanylyltransferase [Porphyromonas pogonae]
MENNFCVIMGGGIGSRFWPLSLESYPKQFLDFFGLGRSLLQMTYDRFLNFVPKENILIVTNENYAQTVREQLPELSSSQILTEPTRRNTAPAIAYACYNIYAKNPEANIIVAPSDHLILRENEFVKAAEKALNFVREQAQLVTLGIMPSRPETGYGYIQMADDKIGDFIQVKTFTEKPNREMAEVFIQSGEFLWNSGMFVWNVRSILKAFRQHLPEISSLMDEGLENKFNTDQEQDFIHKAFPLCPNISIDYGIMEKAENVMVLPVDFGWADLGTWGSLYELSPKDEQENVSLKTKSMFYEAHRNIVSVDDPDKLVVVQGIDDCVIAEANNVLLICKQDQEQRIKHFSADASINFDQKYN